MTSTIRTDADRPPVQFDEETREWHIRASALGYCTRALVFAGQGLTPAATPTAMLEKYAEGHAAEDFIRGVSMDRVSGDITSLARTESRDARRIQLYVELENYGGAWINGEYDDQFTFDGGSWLEEYKALGRSYAPKLARVSHAPNNAELWKVLPRAYPWQASVYMLAAGLPLRFVPAIKHRDGTVTDEDQVLAPWLFTEPPHTLEEIHARVRGIIAAIDGTAELPACPKPFDFPCGFYALHDEDEDAPEEVGEDEAAEFRELFRQREAAMKVANIAAAKKKAAEERLQELLDDRRWVTIPGAAAGDESHTVKVTISDVPESTPKPRAAHTRTTWTFK